MAVALVAGIFLVLGAVALGRDKTRRADTNGVQPDAFIVDLRPGQEACLARVIVPRDAKRRANLCRHTRSSRPDSELSSYVTESGGLYVGESSERVTATRNGRSFPSSRSSG